MNDSDELRDQKPGLTNSETDVSLERKKAGQAGRLFFLGSVVFFLLAAVTAIAGFPRYGFTAVGVSLLLLVVGSLLVAASKKQRRRDPRKEFNK